MTNLARILGFVTVLFWVAPSQSIAANELTLASANPTAIPSPPRDDPNSVEGEDPPVDPAPEDDPPIEEDPPAE